VSSAAPARANKMGNWLPQEDAGHKPWGQHPHMQVDKGIPLLQQEGKWAGSLQYLRETGEECKP